MHRSTGVANDIETDVGFLHVAFDAKPIISGVKTPIEMPQIVAGLIIAIVTELNAEAVEWAVVQAAEETFHDVAGFEIEAFEGGQQFGVETFEYTPKEVKQAVAGYGSAEKRQVQEMVRALLQLDSIPKPDDAADALAIAITHLNTKRYDLV